MFANLERAVKHDSQTTAAQCFAPAAYGAAADGASNGAHIAGEIKRLKQWFKANVDSNAMSPVSTESEILSKEQVDAIVEARAATTPPATRAVVVSAVRREAALQPANAQYLLGTQSLMVGHRVAFVAERGASALFGARGYIVAIHARETAQPASHPSNGRHVDRPQQEGLPADKIQMVEILLDKPFANGTTLDGKCPPYRGALVPPTQVLDLTSWSLGQSVASRPSAGPRTVDTIRSVPVPAAQPMRGDAAALMAKARAILGG
ncbi:exonuclease II Exo2, partial [Coemansia nantahalensis]